MNQGFPLTEMVIETVLRDGLGELRANPSRIDNLFARFTEAHFGNQYGQSKIDEIKQYITSKQVKIVHAFSMQPTVMPCFSIQMISTHEDEADQHLGNAYSTTTFSKTPNVAVSDVTSTSYDSSTGKLILDPATDLSTVCPNLIYVDNLGNKFTILSGISNESGNKYINIGKGQNPSIGTDGRIESSIDFDAYERRMIRMRETVRVGVHAKDDIHLAKFLYYILYYIIKSRQEAMINRGIHLDRGMVSVFDRLDEFEGENVFSRYYDLHCLVEFNWNQEQVAVADCFDVNVTT
jgi:hypothetical protein